MRRQGGFTLIELMIVMAIFGVMMEAVVMAIRMNQQSWEVSDSYMAVTNELRRGADAMNQDLVPAAGSSLSVPADGNWYSTLTFKVPSDLDGNGTVLNNGTGALELSGAITYSLGGQSNGQIIRAQAGTADRVMANGVTALQFRRTAADPGVVEISMAVQRGSGTFVNQAATTAKIRVRN